MRDVAKFLSVLLVIVGIATQAGGQERRKLPRIGVLMSGSEASSRIQLDGLRKGLTAAGIAEGSGVVLDIKYADGKVDRLDPLAVELVKSRPDVLFTGGDQGASAVKRAAAGHPPS
jgi:putative ABC transport system substrate-binding protein